MPQSHHPSHDAAPPTPPARPPATAPVVPAPAPAAPDAIPFFESPTWTWPEFDPECCQECGRTIPLHETGYILGLDIVCEECHEILSALRTSRLKLLRQAAMMQRPVSRPVTTPPAKKPVTTPPLAPAAAVPTPVVEPKPQPARPATKIEPAPTTIEVTSPSVQLPAPIVEDAPPIPASSAPTFALTGSFIWRNHFAADVAALLTDDEGIAIPTDGTPLFDEPPFALTSASFVYRACFGDEAARALHEAEVATTTTASIIDDSMPLFDEPPFELTAAPFEPRACFADGMPAASAMIASASHEDIQGSRPPADDGVTLFDEPPFELEPAAFQWRPHFADGLATTGNSPAAATDVAHLTTTATDEGLTLFDEPPFELEPAPFEYRAHFAHDLAALRCDAGLATTTTDDGVTLFDEPPFELEPAPFVPRATFATVAVDDAPPPPAPAVDAGMPLLDWRDDEVEVEPAAEVQAEVEVEPEVPVEVEPSLEDVLTIEVERQAEAAAPIEAELQVETEAPVVVEVPAQVVADIAEVAEVVVVAEVENIAAIEVEVAAPVDAVALDVGLNVETSLVADVVAEVEPVVDVVDVAAIDVTPVVPTAMAAVEIALVVADEAIDNPVVTSTDSASDDAASIDVPIAAAEIEIVEIVEIGEIGEIAEIAEMAKTVEIPEVAKTDAADAMNLDDGEVVAEIDDLPLEDVAPVAAPAPVPADQAPVEPTPVEPASTVEAPVEQCPIEQASVEQTPPAIAPPPPPKQSESIMPIIDSALAESVKPIFRDKPTRPSHPSLGAQTPEPPPPPARLKARSRRRPKPAPPASRPPADSPLSFKHPVDALLDKLHAEQIDAGVWQTLNQWRAKDRFFADVAAMLDVADDLLGDWMTRRESQDKERKSTG